jgi:hypothetical protein
MFYSWGLNSFSIVLLGRLPCARFFCLKGLHVSENPKRRLTPAQWAEAEAQWAAGTVTYDDLVAKYGCAMSTFERHFKKHHIVKGSAAAATRKAVEDRLVAASVDEATILAARIKETKEQHYVMSSNLGKLIWNELLEAKKAGNPVSSVINNLKALDLAATGLKKVREERWAVLGLDRPDAVDPDEVPELQITELTADQIQALRDRDHDEMDDVAPQKDDDGDDGDPPDEEDGNNVVEEG